MLQAAQRKQVPHERKSISLLFPQKTLFLIIQVLKPFAPQGQGPHWPFPAHTEHNSINKIVLECPEIFASSPGYPHPLCKHRYKLPCCCCFATPEMPSAPAKIPAPVQVFSSRKTFESALKSIWKPGFPRIDSCRFRCPVPLAAPSLPFQAGINLWLMLVQSLPSLAGDMAWEVTRPGGAAPGGKRLGAGMIQLSLALPGCGSPVSEVGSGQRSDL